MTPENALAQRTAYDLSVADLEESFAKIDQQKDQSFQNWYLAERNKIEACEKVLNEQFEDMKAELAARMKALEWRFGKEFEGAVRADISEQKPAKKSVKYLCGTAGTRMGKTSLEVFDEKAAIKWAMANGCKDALELKLARKTPLLEKIEQDGIVPDGCNFRPAEENFYPASEKKRLPAAALAKGLPEGQ